MRKKYFGFLFFTLLFFHPGYYESNLLAQMLGYNQDVLQHEVKVTLKLIQVYIIDEKELPIKDLSISDFELFDNGKAVKITEFEKHLLPHAAQQMEEGKPIFPSETLSLINRKFFIFFDFSFNDPGGIIRAKNAALYFIGSQVHQTDEVGVISYSAKRGFTIHEYLTFDMEKVRDAIQGFGIEKALGRAVELEDIYSRSIEQMVPEDIKIEDFRTSPLDKEIERWEANIRQANKDAYKHEVSRFCSEMINFARALRYISGCKQIILFSKGVADFILYGRRGASKDLISGEDHYGSAALRATYETMIKELAASNCLVYAVNVERLKSRISSNSLDMVGDHSLRQLAINTGGKYFSYTMDHKQSMEQIQNITSTYYVLGYYIDEKWDGRYHRINVSVKRKGCKVLGLGGYFNPKPFVEYSEFEKLLHLIDLALSDKPHLQNSLQFPMISIPYQFKKGQNLLLISKISEEYIKDILNNKLELVTLIFDRQNNIVEFTRDELNASKFVERRIYYYTIAMLPPGLYDCRTVVRNLKTGKGAIASLSVIISEATESGLYLYPPLLLLPEKNAFYLKGTTMEERKQKSGTPSLLDIYPFDGTQYAPLVEDTNQKNYKFLVVIRCSTIVSKPLDIRLGSYLIHYPTGNRIPAEFSVLHHYQHQDSEIFFIELQMEEMLEDKYILCVFAEDQNTRAKADANVVFWVK